MEYKTLNDGNRMPMLGFGTFLTSDEVCAKSVETAIRKGYRLIDTAEAYGNEEAVGKGIKASGIERSELFVVTKVNFNHYENAYETVIESLRKLDVDYLDLILLHWPFGNYYKAYRDLEKLKEEGKVKSIGVSNFEPDRLIDLIEFNKIRPAINQIETNLFVQRLNEHEWMNKYNVAHMAYAPLGQGNRNEMFDLKEIKILADRYHKTTAQILLRYLIQNDVIVIPKSVHEERIAENIDIFDFKLSDEDMALLKSLDKNEPKIGNPEDPEKVEIAMTWIR